MDLQAGQRVDDRYVLIARLGKGGQGEVWRVEDTLKPGAPRAAKLMSVAKAKTVQIERVRREAKQLVQLDHPSLVTCYALFEDVRQDVMGLVMDYVEGESLESLTDDPRLTPQHRLAVLGHIASVLAYVHQRSVVHRDIKLGNVIIGNDFFAEPNNARHLKVIDFGISAPSGNPKPLTQLGVVIGTPGYMPPEVIDPDYWRADTSRPTGDVFAWGVLAWKLLVGGHPTGLAGGTMKDLAAAYRQAHEQESPWPLGPEDAAWARVVGKALTLDAMQRPTNGLALVELLQREIPEVTTAPFSAPTPPLGQLAAAGPHSTTVADRAGVSPETTAPLPLHLQETVLSPPQFNRPSARPPQATSSPLPAHEATSNRQPLTRRHLMLALAAGGGLVIGVLIVLVGALVVVSRSRVLDTPNERAEPTTSAATRTAALVLPKTDCASGVPCEPNCSELLSSEARFELRFIHAHMKGGSLHSSYPDAVVCTSVRGHSVEACTSVKSVVTSRFAKGFLTVTHSDLALRGLNIRVLDRPGGATLASATAARPKQGVIKRTALCRGYLVPGPFRGKVPIVNATFYLHPEGSPAPRQEPSKANHAGGSKR